MSSMALGVLIKTQRAASARNAHFALCGLHPRLRSVVVRCFGSLMQLFDSCDEALRTLRQS
jgi:anti-anti-sigma regulatory factor